MKKHDTEEWNEILSYDKLYQGYIVDKIPTNILAKSLGCGVLRLQMRLQTLGLVREKLSKIQPNKPHNKQVIEEKGFILLSEYTNRHAKVKVKCLCGNIFKSSAGHLISGHTKSCGCLMRAKCDNKAHNWCGYEGINGKYFTCLRRNSLKRGLECSINIEYVWQVFELQNKKCKLTGLDLYWDSKKGAGNASVDRIDNTKGYVEGNIQIIHKYVNMMKRHHSTDFLLYIAKLITENNKIDTNNLYDWEQESL